MRKVGPEPLEKNGVIYIYIYLWNQTTVFFPDVSEFISYPCSNQK